MVDDGDSCCTALGLGIGLGKFILKSDPSQVKKVVSLDLSFPQHPKDEAVNTDDNENNNNNNNNSSSRKKLRLSKEQSALLEESYALHNTLNSNKKQTLVERLNLQPRQVEVWFQNRRARTKLKQTEVDCEYMKKCCESLREENHRLKKELQELKYIQLPNAASPLKLCPSCTFDKATSIHLQKNNVKEEKEETI